MEQIIGDFFHAHNKDTARDHHGKKITISFGGDSLKPCVPTQQKEMKRKVYVFFSPKSFVLMKV